MIYALPDWLTDPSMYAAYVGGMLAAISADEHIGWIFIVWNSLAYIALFMAVVRLVAGISPSSGGQE